MSDFAQALEAALAGGPQRHHEKTEEQGKLPVRERVERLVDAGSFVEYGRFAIAAQRGRREVEDLIARTPADGLSR